MIQVPLKAEIMPVSNILGVCATVGDTLTSPASLITLLGVESDRAANHCNFYTEFLQIEGITTSGDRS